MCGYGDEELDALDQMRAILARRRTPGPSPPEMARIVR
jgi:hypothetical protein